VRELVPHYSNPVALGEYLVRIDWLTPYQLQLLLAGQWADLAVGPYQILDRLGDGGVSEVFKAWDTQRGRIVALNTLRQPLAPTRRRGLPSVPGRVKGHHPPVAPQRHQELRRRPGGRPALLRDGVRRGHGPGALRRSGGAAVDRDGL